MRLSPLLNGRHSVVSSRVPRPRAVVPRSIVLVLCALSLVLCSACAALQGLRAFIQPPHFEQDDQQRSEIRLNGTTGAAVRIWTRVSNPNNFGVTIGTLRGTLHLEGSRAATVDFPFGLPLAAQSQKTVPIDISVDFRDLQGLGQAIARAIARQPIDFELEGTIGVSAGGFGEHTLGPLTFLRGELR
jgi:LEA14-like dessication related protein